MKQHKFVTDVKVGIWILNPVSSVKRVVVHANLMFIYLNCMLNLNFYYNMSGWRENSPRGKDDCPKDYTGPGEKNKEISRENALEAGITEDRRAYKSANYFGDHPYYLDASPKSQDLEKGEKMKKKPEFVETVEIYTVFYF